MGKYFVSGLTVTNLWGQRDFDLVFNKDVNILIGPNASGKTTLLNLLRFVLTVDIVSLSDIQFKELSIPLKSFTGPSKRTVKVIQNKSELVFHLGNRSFPIEMEPPGFRSFSPSEQSRWRRRQIQMRARDFQEQLRAMVPAVWLPVSRRLPMPEEEEETYHRAGRTRLLESVDERLRELIRQLNGYRSTLNSQLVARSKEFETHVFEVMLYSKEHDLIGIIKSEPPPTQAEKQQLLHSFRAAGLLTPQMESRIDEHFSKAEEALSNIARVDSQPAQQRKYMGSDVNSGHQTFHAASSPA